VNVAPYEQAADTEWDDLVRLSPMGTFLHTRSFLGYHGDRFEDASVVLRTGEGELIGVMPAAVDPADPRRVASHPGATFGGLVHGGALSGPAMLEAMAATTRHYRERGFAELAYAPVPTIYHRQPSADDRYALARQGAVCARIDLSCAVDLEDGARLSSRRRRGLAKAHRSGAEVAEGADLLEELWPVVEANLAERHGARPVHDAAEMRRLIGLFPDDIAVVVSRLRGEPVAGVVLFESERVSHAQYIASIAAGNDVGALDAVFDHCLARAAGRGARFFDFGTSNREGGRVLNAGLYEFKAQFGGGGVAYEHYELDLSAATPKPVSP
jgi:hypothetical protein